MTVRDSGGNVQVDFVWGNFPLQPNDDRGIFTLDPTLDNHSIATTGYSNFPGYIPNYSGDGDTGLEVAVPNVTGLHWNEATAILSAAGLQYSGFFETIVVTSVTSSGKTVTLNVEDSLGVVKGMPLWVNVTDDADPANTTSWNEVKVTGVTATTIKFVVDEAPSPALNITVTSSDVYGDGTTLSQDLEPGMIVNTGTTVTLRNIWD